MSLPKWYHGQTSALTRSVTFELRIAIIALRALASWERACAFTTGDTVRLTESETLLPVGVWHVIVITKLPAGDGVTVVPVEEMPQSTEPEVAPVQVMRQEVTFWDVHDQVSGLPNVTVTGPSEPLPLRLTAEMGAAGVADVPATTFCAPTVPISLSPVCVKW